MKLVKLAITVICLLVTHPSQSHHSPASVYIMTKVTTLDGTVTDFRFINPHVRIHVDVVNDDGQTEEWIVEGGSPNVLLRNGWSPDTFKPGDPIHIFGNPPIKESSLFIHMLKATLPEGKELFGEDANIESIERIRRSRSR
jgi:hypothetical protein